MQGGGGRLAAVVLQAGDVLLLHCMDRCPLLLQKEPAIGSMSPGGLGLSRGGGGGAFLH